MLEDTLTALRRLLGLSATELCHVLGDGCGSTCTRDNCSKFNAQAVLGEIEMYLKEPADPHSDKNNNNSRCMDCNAPIGQSIIEPRLEPGAMIVEPDDQGTFRCFGCWNRYIKGQVAAQDVAGVYGYEAGYEDGKADAQEWECEPLREELEFTASFLENLIHNLFPHTLGVTHNVGATIRGRIQGIRSILKEETGEDLSC